MAPDGAWVQWVEEECIVIRPWVYCLLGLFWPLLRLVYRDNTQSINCFGREASLLVGKL